MACSITGSKLRRGGAFFAGISFAHTYEDIISVENLLCAWREFARGKRTKPDVQKFQHRLMDNILALHHDLAAGAYRHGGYRAFKINDPKPREIHKASVRDRLLHHALYRQLYWPFDRTFIADSYSCRNGKGVHRAMRRFRKFARKVSQNGTRTCWVLKCDVRKFFASIDQHMLMETVARRIDDRHTVSLIGEVVQSFNSRTDEKGLPLGNLTSQLLVNIYMNEFDQFVKHTLKAKYYIRYADNFVILSRDHAWLSKLLPEIASFLETRLKLSLHPQKVYVKTFASGVDFLGWIHFPDHRVLRTATKRRMVRRLAESSSDGTKTSYRGLLSHGNAWKLRSQLLN